MTKNKIICVVTDYKGNTFSLTKDGATQLFIELCSLCRERKLSPPDFRGWEKSEFHLPCFVEIQDENGWKITLHNEENFQNLLEEWIYDIKQNVSFFVVTHMATNLRKLIYIYNTPICVVQKILSSTDWEKFAGGSLEDLPYNIIDNKVIRFIAIRGRCELYEFINENKSTHF